MSSTNTAVVDELIEMRGLRFHFRDWPSKRLNAPSLVLLHGFTGHARSWDLFAEAMTDRYRVLALDQRGHGESGWAAADRYGIDDMANDLESFVQALGLRGLHAHRLVDGRPGYDRICWPPPEGTRGLRYRRYRPGN